MKKINAIVVGVGHLGKEHARVYSQLKGVHLAGVVDTDASRAREIAERLGTVAYTDLAAVPGPIDVASISVPTTLHYDVARALIQRDVHLLVEKPFMETLEQAQEISSTSRKRGLILQVGHIERFNPAFKTLDKHLRNPKFIECHRLCMYNPRGTDVDVVMDLMIHDIDIILELVKSEVQEIRAVGVNVLSKTEDIANARLEFANGCVANITASRVSPENMRKIRVFKDDVYISLDYMKRHGLIYWKEDEKILHKEIPSAPGEPIVLEIQHFIECVVNEKEPLVTATHGTRALEVAMQIIEQSRNRLWA
ncbi:MAG: Gfo/Idh/MocA family oxidoreductase [Candidatus Theseobacter exili]|nr:Gfo/Idh/MocA family oxidoreductase [Candidatus Theseobacter exili]